ncbi:MAG: hypothetical protein NT121_24565 [Chloroflexi bacterium]|nr:hypothetical protein [Chloroflexota bacterium]
MYLFSELNLLSLLLLLALWTLGGWLMTARAFNLPARERGLVSLGLGLVLGTWLARDLFPREAFQTAQWLIFIAAVVLFTLIGRGLGFFDDHQNLAPVSIMATGDVPPHFSYNPDLRFGYHYFLLLVASQFVRLAAAGPWTALDLARGLTLALTLTYGGFVALRLTKSKLAQSLTLVFMAFAGGARWLFLLLPIALQRQLSSSVQLIGSGADTGPNLITAIYKYWKIEGLGPLPFPFLFGSGLDPSFSMFHNGWGTSALTMALLLMLLAGVRNKDWRANLPIVVLLASIALANEVTFAFLYAGLAFAALAWILQQRSLRLPRSLWVWVGLMFIGGVLALLQGGMFTEVARGWLERQSAAGGSTYFRVGFALGLPTVLSAHLGYLSLLNPLQWVAILGETGLAVFALPIVLKQLPAFSRDENWFEAAWIGSVVVSLLMVFVQYTGNAGPTAASRMQAHFLTVVKIYAVPLLWLWARERSENVKTALFAWGLAAIFSGVSLFGLQMAAMPNPVYAIYLNQLDAQMFSRQWDRLAPNTMVYDPVYPRAATVLGRPTRSSKTMGETLPEWNALGENPDPFALKAAGYDYLYVDLKYFTKYSAVIQNCAQLIDQVDDKNGAKVVDSRYLFRVTDCR